MACAGWLSRATACHTLKRVKQFIFMCALRANQLYSRARSRALCKRRLRVTQVMLGRVKDFSSKDPIW